MEISVSDLNFIVQLLTFGFLFLGIFYVRKRVRDLKKHRNFIAVALVLNIVSIFLVMGRSFLGSVSHLTEEFYVLTPMITWAHGLTGGFAEILGITFLFKHPPKIRWGMRLTAILWTIALLLGIYIYYLHSLNLHPH